MRLDVGLFPLAPLSDQVWALRHDLTSCVAWFVAVAEAFCCPLILLDRRLHRSSGPSCQTVVPGATSPEPRSYILRPVGGAGTPC